jgi:hypothetical protein
MKAEFVCSECPLVTCDEDSLWCAFRWATNPNAAQLKVATVRLIPKRLTDAERSRRWRQKNPERYARVRREYRERKAARRQTVNG